MKDRSLWAAPLLWAKDVTDGCACVYRLEWEGKYYVGSSINFYARLVLWRRRVKTSGDVQVRILWRGHESKRYAKEAYYIKKLGTFAPIGHNKTPAGRSQLDLSYMRTPECLAKRAEAMRRPEYLEFQRAHGKRNQAVGKGPPHTAESEAKRVAGWKRWWSSLSAEERAAQAMLKNLAAGRAKGRVLSETALANRTAAQRNRRLREKEAKESACPY